MKKLLFTLAMLLPLLFSACGNDDKEPDFAVPTLTDNNTIRFTVDMDSKLSLNIEAILGEKTAVDWGDGTVNKYYISDPSQRVGHRYKNSGRYLVKIWADEVTLFNLASLFYNTVNFNLGHCLQLETLAVNSINGMTRFELGENCPKLTYLNIGSCPNLTSVDVSKCENIEFIQCYNNQALTHLDVSKNNKLRRLDCGENQLETLIANSNLFQLACSGNKLSSLDVGYMKELTELSVSENGVMTIDLSKLSKLSTLLCGKNDLITLDISNNPLLRVLQVNENKLTSVKMDAEANKYLRVVDLSYNELSKEELYKVFDALPQVAEPKTSVTRPNNGVIYFNNNPGVEEAGFSGNAVKAKGWTIETRNKIEK